MWATDGKKFFIDGIGWHWFFGVIDHFNDEIILWHIVKKGNRIVLGVSGADNGSFTLVGRRFFAASRIASSTSVTSFL
jgi:hypothetical protein